MFSSSSPRNMYERLQGSTINDALDVNDQEDGTIIHVVPTNQKCN